MGLNSGRLHDAVTTAQLLAKADAAQEAWITPTLLNSWEAFDASRTAQYRKETTGVVRLKGMVKSGTIGQAIFTLPVGYRPSVSTNISTTSLNLFGAINIGIDGLVTPAVGNNAWVSLSSITFTPD